MPVSFETDIRPLFRSKDINCMKNHDVLLADYAYMSDPEGDSEYPDHANARRVHCFLSPNACTPQMPLGGPFWSDAQLALLSQWMADGFQP